MKKKDAFEIVAVLADDIDSVEDELMRWLVELRRIKTEADRLAQALRSKRS
ncbi:hypothetical protein [Ruegeria arenilitoris]|uniref:hypothetical protein n=1 Tax=Ruegeria arenilitoris TaxID=1173585 RepID=UPI00147ABC48|nr:hypothetical protein [Ruegeria arenilitoris]